MAEHTEADEERRRTPRFHCGGQVKISRLPSEGIILPGTLRDLSLCGCCLDTDLPIESGTRTEVVVRVNGASFRAVGIVKARREKSAASIEFVQLSAGGRELLADLVTELATLKAIVSNLISARREMDAESFRRQIEAGRLHAAMFSARYPFLNTTLPAEISEQDRIAAAREELTVKEPLVTPVNLFG